MPVTAKELSKILGVSDRRIRQLVEEKVLEKDPDSKKYFLPACVQKFIAYKANAQSGGTDTDYFHQRSMHEKTKREKAEIELSHLQGRMHSADDVELVMTDMIAKSKTRLRGIPAKVAPSLVAQTDLSAVERILAAEIDQCLSEIAQYSPDMFRTAASPGGKDG
jgi:hypothetical protein